MLRKKTSLDFTLFKCKTPFKRNPYKQQLYLIEIFQNITFHIILSLFSLRHTMDTCPRPHYVKYKDKCAAKRSQSAFSSVCFGLTDDTDLG